MVRDDIEREKKAEWESILNGKLPETTLQKAQREKMDKEHELLQAVRHGL